VEKQIRVKEKRPGGVRRGITLLATVLLGIVACVLFGGLYFFQELLFFVGLAALLVFFAASLYLLGILAYKAGQGILGFFRTVKPITASQGHIQNEQQDDFLRSPVISRAAGSSPA